MSGSNTDSNKRADCEAQYQHQPLEHNDSIRLLKLEPASMPTAELYGQLIHERLSANSAYAAVSYTWGDPIFPKVLNLAGGILKITENLHSALRAFRDRRQPRMLWVDGVCIDQANPDDKNHQVALMSEIYKRANKVLGWLGDETPRVRICYSLPQTSSSALRIGNYRGELRDLVGTTKVKFF